MTGPELRSIPVGLLEDHPRNPRRILDDLDELAASIREHGVLEPIVVTARGERFAVVMGRRRVAAAALAGVPTVPAIVRAFSDDEAAVAALVENLQRKDLTPVEESHALEEVRSAMSWSERELARRIGKTQAMVNRSLKLLKVADSVREALERRRDPLSAAAARETLRLTEPEDVAELDLSPGKSIEDVTGQVNRLLAKRGKPPKKARRKLHHAPAPASTPRPKPERKLVKLSLLADLALALKKGKSAQIVRIASRIVGLDVTTGRRPRRS